MSILEDVRVLAESGLVCDACLGRAFVERSLGLTNAERDKSFRVAAVLDDNEPYEVVDIEDRRAYEGACAKFDDQAGHCAETIEDVEAEMYQVGTRTPPPVEENELFPREGTGLPEDAGELLKSKLNREVGKCVGRLTGIEVDFTRPDVQFPLDIEADTVEAQLNSVFVYGRHRKLARDIPQTEWSCRECDGSGHKGKEPCDYCDGSGYPYEDSVEGFVAPVVTDVMDGIDAKFHGAGREDVDTLMFGMGRPFAAEIMEPRRRTVDVEQLEGDINVMADDEIEVEGLRLATYDMVGRVKELDVSREYRTAVKLDDDVTDTELAAALDELTGVTVEQYTPNRVDHCRTSITRTHHVYDAIDDLRDPCHVTVEVHGEDGLYIKEFAPGDEGRTNPSLAGIPDTDAAVTAFDVVAVEGEDEPFEDDAFFKD